MQWGITAVLIFVGIILARVLARPAYLLVLALARSMAGYVALWALNGVGMLVGLHLPLNPLTALIVGLLGLPGVLAVYLLHRLYTL